MTIKVTMFVPEVLWTCEIDERAIGLCQNVKIYPTLMSNEREVSMRRPVVPIIALAAAAMAGCNLTMPQEITVKADPTLTVPAGTRSFEISEYFNVEQELDNLVADIDGLSRVETEVGQPLRLAIDHEIANVSVDDFVTEDLGLTELSETVSVDYTVPDFDIAPQSISSDVPPVTLSGVTIPNTSVSDIPEPDGNGAVTVPVPPATAGGFTDVTFASGTLTATMTVSNATAGMTVQVTGANIRHDDGDPETATGDVITSATNQPVVTDGEPLTFDLAGAEFPAAFEFELELAVTGGTGGQFFDSDISCSLSGDTTVNAATGVDFADQVTGSTFVELDPGLDFVSATVDTGNITIDLTRPAGWTGITTEPTITVLQDGNPIAGPTALAPEPYVLDLSGVTFTNEDIEVQYTIDVTGTNASFELDPAADEVTTDVTTSISRFSEVVVSDASFDTVESFSQTLDEEMTNLVESVTFTNPVLTIELDNQLPVDVEIQISSTSDGSPLTLTPVNGPATYPIGDARSFDWEIDPNPMPVDMTELNVDVAVLLDDGDTGDGVLTLTNVVPGTAYSLSGDVNAVFDIEQLTVGSVDETGDFPEESEPGIDFSALGDFLPPSVAFEDVDGELSVTIDSSGDFVELYVYADYDGGSIDLVGTSLDPEEISAGGTTEIPINFDQILNDAPSDLRFHYDVAPIVLEPGTGQSLRVALTASIPLAFTSDSARGASELTTESGDPIVPGLEEDMFGRTGVSEEDEEIEEMLRHASRVRLRYDIENNLGIGLMVEITEPADAVRGLEEFSKEINLSDGPGTIGLDPADIERIASDPVFTPQIHLLLPDGAYGLLTGGNARLSATMEIDTDIEHTFSLMGGQE